MTTPPALNKTMNCVAAVLTVVSGGSVMAQPANSDVPLRVTAASNPYVVDGNHFVVRNHFGDCWRTGFWTPALAAATRVENSSKPIGCFCDPALMPAVVCADQVPKIARLPVMPAPVPVVPLAPVASKVTIPADALFAFDSEALSAAGKTELDALLVKIGALNLEAIVAVGYADRIGSMTYNMALSERRARTIKNYLASTGGIEPGRIFVEGRGETMPVTGDACNNMGPENASNKKLVVCLAPDRRVDVEAVGVPK